MLYGIFDHCNMIPRFIGYMHSKDLAELYCAFQNEINDRDYFAQEIDDISDAFVYESVNRVFKIEFDFEKNMKCFDEYEYFLKTPKDSVFCVPNKHITFSVCVKDAEEAKDRATQIFEYFNEVFDGCKCWTESVEKICSRFYLDNKNMTL